MHADARSRSRSRGTQNMSSLRAERRAYGAERRLLKAYGPQGCLIPYAAQPRLPKAYRRPTARSAA
jgi:hypothetical protein